MDFRLFSMISWMLVIDFFSRTCRALEQAGSMLKEMKKMDEAAELMQRAGSLYQEHGTPDTAALVLVKAAKYIC